MKSSAISNQSRYTTSSAIPTGPSVDLGHLWTWAVCGPGPSVDPGRLWTFCPPGAGLPVKGGVGSLQHWNWAICWTWAICGPMPPKQDSIKSSTSPPPLLPGKNLVTVFSAICLALSKDFNSSNTWSWPSTTSWTTVRTTSRSRPWSCPSIPLLSLDQGEVFSSYMDLVPLFLHLLDQEGISERLLVPVPLFWLMM